MTEVGKITIRVSPDTSRFRRELKAQLEEIENRLSVNIDVDPDMKGFRQRVKAETQGLKADVQLDVDRSVFSRLREQLSKIEAPSFGSGVNGAGFAAIFAGVAAVAAPAMALLTSSLLAVPGLLAAVAAPIGAITLGLDGIKAAASRLTAPFEALKATMSKFTEAQFTPVFDKLGAIFPKLAKSLPKVSQGLADVAQSIVDTVTSSGGMAKIEATITNIGKAISKSAPGIGDLTEGLLTLAQSFSEKLPNLSDWVNGAGKSFTDWVKRITEDGTLSKAFDGLGGTLKTLAEALGSMASEGLKFMQDPKKIEDFNQGLKNIADTLTRIVSLSNELNNGKLFTTALPSFDTEKIKQDLLTPFTSADAPWRSMAASIKAAFADVSATVSSTISGVVSAFNGVVSQFQSAWAAIPGIAAGIWSQVVSAVAQAISQAVAAVVQGGAQVVAEVSSWPGKIVGALGDLTGTLAAIGRNAASALVSGLVSGISAGVSSVTGAIGDLLAKARAFFPNSPAKTGPFSGAGWVDKSGLAIGQALADGITNSTSAVVAAARGLMDETSDALAPGDVGSGWNSQFKKLGQVPFDFATANIEQLTSDLGISGDGAISQFIKQGVAFGEQAVGNTFNFQVNSVDDAIAAQQTLQNKQALQYTGR